MAFGVDAEKISALLLVLIVHHRYPVPGIRVGSYPCSDTYCGPHCWDLFCKSRNGSGVSVEAQGAARNAARVCEVSGHAVLNTANGVPSLGSACLIECPLGYRTALLAGGQSGQQE